MLMFISPLALLKQDKSVNEELTCIAPLGPSRAITSVDMHPLSSVTITV